MRGGCVQSQQPSVDPSPTPRMAPLTCSIPPLSCSTPLCSRAPLHALQPASAVLYTEGKHSNTSPTTAPVLSVTAAFRLSIYSLPHSPTPTHCISTALTSEMSESSPDALTTELTHLITFYEESGSPFDAALLRHTAAALSSSSPASASLQRIFRPFSSLSLKALHGAAIGPRWNGAWRSLVFREVDPALTSAYPSAANAWQGDADAFWRRMLALMEQYEEDVKEFMGHEPQTNEVNRCLAFLPCYLLLEQRFKGLPLVGYEIGASAGLNTLWPHFHFALTNDGSVTWGDKESPVRLSTEWRGLPIPAELAAAPLRVTRVVGCDQRRIDLSNEAEALRLRCYVWSNQKERLERLDAAVHMAQQRGVQVEEGDAADWTEANVQLMEGSVTVLYHSFVWRYLPSITRRRIEAHMRKLGEEATETSPLAWLSQEEREEEDTSNGFAGIAVRLRAWPGDVDVTVAECHPHCRWVDVKSLDPIPNSSSSSNGTS